MRTDQAKRLKELERENARPKKLVAEAELDKAVLEAAASRLVPREQRRHVPSCRPQGGKAVRSIRHARECLRLVRG